MTASAQPTPAPAPTPASTSPVVDPVASGPVDTGKANPDPSNPTTGANRYTIHVPSELTVLSVGQAEGAKWKTDIGITGYTANRIHFETKTNDKTLVSLGGPPTTAYSPVPPPASMLGYAMVTAGNAWHEAMIQHYFISQKADICLNTPAAGRRAVVQCDKGIVAVIGGTQVNLSGTGVAIGGGELELEDVGYGGSWVGKRPHSKAAAGSKLGNAIVGALAALPGLIPKKNLSKFADGAFANTPDIALDVVKWVLGAAGFAAGVAGMFKMHSDTGAPATSVKLDAADNISAMARGSIGFFGTVGANMGAAAYATVTAGISATLTALGLAAVGGSYVSVKGVRKVEVASDWGTAGITASGKVEIAAAEKAFVVSAAGTGHLASINAALGATMVGGATKTWIGSNTGSGILLNADGFAMGGSGNAAGADMTAATIQAHPAIRIAAADGSILLQGAENTSMKLSANTLVLLAGSRMTIDAKSGPTELKASGSILLN